MTFIAEFSDDDGFFVGRTEGFAAIDDFGVADTVDADFLAVLLAGVS